MAGTRACCPPKQRGQVAPEKEPGSGNHQGPEGASGAERGRAAASSSGMDGGGQVQPAGRKRHPTDVSSRSLSRVCVLHIVNRRGSKLSLAPKSSSAPRQTTAGYSSGGRPRSRRRPCGTPLPVTSDWTVRDSGTSRRQRPVSTVGGRRPASRSERVHCRIFGAAGGDKNDTDGGGNAGRRPPVPTGGRVPGRKETRNRNGHESTRRRQIRILAAGMRCRAEWRAEPGAVRFAFKRGQGSRLPPPAAEGAAGQAAGPRACGDGATPTCMHPFAFQLPSRPASGDGAPASGGRRPCHPRAAQAPSAGPAAEHTARLSFLKGSMWERGLSPSEGLGTLVTPLPLESWL